MKEKGDKMKNERDPPRTRDTSYAFINAFVRALRSSRDSISNSIRNDRSIRNAEYFFIFICRCLSFLYRSTSSAYSSAYSVSRMIHFHRQVDNATDKRNRNIDVSPT